MTDGVYATTPYPLGWGLGRGHVAPRDAWTDVGLDTQFGVARGPGQAGGFGSQAESARVPTPRGADQRGAVALPPSPLLIGAEAGRIARDVPIVKAPVRLLQISDTQISGAGAPPWLQAARGDSLACDA